MNYDKKIASTTITDEAFNEIESELLELEHKRGVVRNQVLALVAEAQGMCKLDAKVKGTVNSLYSELNAKNWKIQVLILQMNVNFISINRY